MAQSFPPKGREAEVFIFQLPCTTGSGLHPRAWVPWYFWPAPCSVAKRQHLGRELRMCTVGRHWCILGQWVPRRHEGPLTASAPLYKLVSWLGSLPRLWPTSFVVCYVVGLLRLTKQTSWSGTSEGCWQNTCIMSKNKFHQLDGQEDTYFNKNMKLVYRSHSNVA